MQLLPIFQNGKNVTLTCGNLMTCSVTRFQVEFVTLLKSRRDIVILPFQGQGEFYFHFFFFFAFKALAAEDKRDESETVFFLLPIEAKKKNAPRARMRCANACVFVYEKQPNQYH